MTTLSVGIHSEQKKGYLRLLIVLNKLNKIRRQASKYIHTNSAFESQVPSTKMRYLPTIAAGLLALSSSISAAPTAESANSTSQEPSSPNSELVGQPEFDLISFYSQLAAASYCPSNIDGGPSILNCSAGNCKDVQNRNLGPLLSFHRK
jgi:hypothetical protein